MRLKCAGGTFNLNGKNDELNPLFPFIPHTSVLLPNVGVALQMTESEGKKHPRQNHVVWSKFKVSWEMMGHKTFCEGTLI